MTESHGEPLPDESPDPDNAKQAGDQGSDAEAHGGAGAEHSGPDTDAQAGSGTVGVGGYGGRDPSKEMPRMPTIPETQGDKADADS